ncbi:hypothetical protein [Nocardia sp. CA-120079]
MSAMQDETRTTIGADLPRTDAARLDDDDAVGCTDMLPIPGLCAVRL